MVRDDENARARGRAIQRLGATVRRKYRLDKLLGIGGMAAVYAATHRNGSRYALKLLHERIDDALERDAFMREARLANSINHPRALKVVDEDLDDDGTPFLVMELLVGETLRARWERNGRHLEPREVSLLSHSLLEVLAVAHANKIVHRDIKPDNLFLTIEGSLYVLDFGIARQIEGSSGAATRAGRASGTPAFMSPEQARGRTRHIDGQSDLWAVGATMFTLLSGAYVHAAAGTAEEFAILSATRPALKIGEIAPWVPAPIAAVIDRALMMDKALRWESATAMQASLAEAHLNAFGESVRSFELPKGITRDLPHLPIADESAEGGPRQEETGASPNRLVEADTTAGIEPSHSAGVATRTSTRSTVQPYPLSLNRFSSRGALIATVGLISITLASALLYRNYANKRGGSVSPPFNDHSADPVKSVSIEANAEFVAGVQSWRDASTDLAQTHFNKALSLDPGFAASRLYSLLLETWTSTYFREQHGEARAQRARLNRPMVALLDALAPLVAVPPDLTASRARLESATKEFPDDQLLRYALALNTMKLGRAREADEQLRALVAADPGFVLPWIAIAYTESEQGNNDAAVAALDACLLRSPFATSCMAELAIFEGNEGHCDRAEQLARMLIAHSPSQGVTAFASNLLAGAIVGQRDDPPAVMAALESSWANASDRPMSEARDFTRYLALSGKFEKASEASATWRSLLSSHRDEAAHESYMKDSMYLELERRNNDKAASIASEFLAKRGTLVADGYFDYEIVGLRGLYLSGAISRETFRSRRETWAARERSRVHLESALGLSWVIGYARNSIDDDDALDAMRALPEYLPIPDPMTRNVESDDAIGWTYLQAGLLEKALPFLKRGASSCRAQLYPFEQTWASLHLGFALEKQGSKPQACASFARVVHRWGSNGSPSVSADVANREYARLGCTSD